MKQQTGIAFMLGKKMEILLEAECVTNLTPSIAAKLPDIMNRLCKSLSIRFVTRYFVKNVRVGETIALVDKTTGYTCRIRRGAQSIRVLEIYDNRHRPQDDATALYLVDWGLLRSVSNAKAVAA